MVVTSALRTGRLYSQEIHLVLISVPMWIRQRDPWLQVRLRTTTVIGRCKWQHQVMPWAKFKGCVFRKLNISEHFLYNICDLLFVWILSYKQWNHVFVQCFPISEGELFFGKFPIFAVYLSGERNIRTNISVEDCWTDVDERKPKCHRLILTRIMGTQSVPRSKHTTSRL